MDTVSGCLSSGYIMIVSLLTYLRPDFWSESNISCLTDILQVMKEYFQVFQHRIGSVYIPINIQFLFQCLRRLFMNICTLGPLCLNVSIVISPLFPILVLGASNIFWWQK